MKTIVKLSLIAFVFTTACKSIQNSSNIKRTLKAQQAFFEDYNPKGIKKHFTENYTQHNPHVPTGRSTIINFLPKLKEAKTTSTTHRVFQDGDFVILHNTYNNAQAFGAKKMVAFDVYRLENGKVAEHWDNLTPWVEKTASGRSQTDGPTQIKDLDKTATNKALVSNFVNDILMGKNPKKITEYISTEQYHQHNVAIEDGLDGLGNAIDYLISQNNMFVVTKLHKVLGQGNFVLSMSEGTWFGKKQAFYDLFRLEDGKIVEHWDVISEIPSKMAHTNGKF